MINATQTKEYNFTLTFKLKEDNINPETYLDQLYEAGCDDTLIGIGKKGYISLDFIREALSAYEAINSAINNVKSVINEAQLIHISPDLVGVQDLANIFECSRQNIQKIVNKISFPTPEYKGSQAIWHLAIVIPWFIAYDYQVKQELLEIAELTMLINLAMKQKISKEKILHQAKNLVAI
jgi:hypothetical protein